MSDPEQLDACDVSFDIVDKNTDDDVVDALILFADVDFTDRRAVARRRAEWRLLFGAAT